MSDVRFSQAAGAYRDALRAAENILQKVSNDTKPTEEASSFKQSPFLDMIGGALQSAAKSGYDSERMATQALSGKADIADVVTAVSNAETSLNMVVAVRDRVITAYQDIIKMPI